MTNFIIHRYPSLISTNSFALTSVQINKNQFNHNHVIIADEQTGGKGRIGRNWVSPIGNLYLSLILKSSKTVAKNSEISFLTSLAVKNAIEFFNFSVSKQSSIQLKWPNDILINSKKVAGILLEGDGEFIVVGVGININSNPDNTSYPATNLENEGFFGVDKMELLNKFLEFFEILYQKWFDFGFAPIRNLWIKDAFNLGKKINVNLPNQSLTGIFKDLDKNGNLVLNVDGKEILISSGEIFTS